MLIHFVSLGCDKNLVDSEIMLGILCREGHTITYDAGLAEAIVVNTCGFIADATEEGIETILELARYKQEGNCKTLIVTGCMAQRYKEDILKELPEVDAVVGSGDFEAIGKVLAQTQVGLCLVTEKRLDESLGKQRLLSGPGYFSYLKIAEGCNHFCTYCTIPAIRGKYRSRPLESLAEETKTLAAQGVKELVLVAQDTSLYGIDIYGSQKLHELLRVLSQVDGIEWIRLMYCYPDHITDELINEIANNPKVCHYIDMPIQHSHENILLKMNRGGRRPIPDIIKKLREKIPDIVLRSTIMVGFPGEGAEEFKHLLRFMVDMQFDRLGAFMYSKEEGTKAYDFANQVPYEVKQKRLRAVMSLQKKISAGKSRTKEGQVFKVIVDGKLPDDNIYCGRTYMDCYELDGMVFFKDSLNIQEWMAGDFVDVLITGSSAYDLIGEIWNADEFAQ